MRAFFSQRERRNKNSIHKIYGCKHSIGMVRMTSEIDWVQLVSSGEILILEHLFESALKSMKCHECVIILNTVKNIERINLAVITNAWNKPNNKRLIELLSTRWCYLLSSNHYATILWQLIIHCIKLWRLENWEWHFFFYSYLGGHCPCKWEVKTSTWEHGIAHSERTMSSTFAFRIFDFRANN